MADLKAHGYSAYVNHGCRCEVCRQGCRDYYRRRRARLRGDGRPQDLTWQDRAECLLWDPEIFFTEKDRRLALHVCQTHCPVLRRCLTWSKRVKAYGAVQGGAVWTDTGRLSTVGYVPDRRCARCP